jgi:hypothetical protein
LFDGKREVVLPFQLMEQMEEQRTAATQIAIEAGVLKRCEYHGEVYDPLLMQTFPSV